MTGQPHLIGAAEQESTRRDYACAGGGQRRVVARDGEGAPFDTGETGRIGDDEIDACHAPGQTAQPVKRVSIDENVRIGAQAVEAVVLPAPLPDLARLVDAQTPVGTPR